MSNLLSSIRELILAQTDINKSVELAEVYGAILWAVDKGIYDDPRLEVALTDRCLSVLPQEESLSATKDCIHLISEPYLIGGHTRLMEQLSTMHSEKPDLLITRNGAEDAIQRTRKFFETCTVVASETVLDRIIEIVGHLKYYKRVVLHIHPDDMVAVIACGILKRITGAEIFFVNHADHVFTYGSSVADVYFELSTFGRRRDMLKQISGKKSFLGIPLSGTLVLKAHALPAKDDALNFFSAASSFKFKPIKNYDLRPAILRVLLEFKNSTFWIIGANPYTNMWWWPLKLRFWKRFKVLSTVPYESYLKLLDSADFYVDSYPSPGGTAFAEQLISGRRCVGLRAPAQGYSPADNLKDESVDEFISSILHRDNDKAIIESVFAVNGYDAVKRRYLACIYGNVVCANEMERYVPWTGDISVYEQIGKISSPIPPVVISKLIEFDRRFLFCLFSELNAVQKLKVATKLAMLGFRKKTKKKTKSSKV